MDTHPSRDVTLCEVGPRDGLQNTSISMPTAQKTAWIEAELACGVTDIRVGTDELGVADTMGVRTGIDLDRLIALRRTVFEQMKGLETYGHLGLAGLPKSFAACV